MCKNRIDILVSKNNFEENSYFVSIKRYVKKQDLNFNHQLPFLFECPSWNSDFKRTLLFVLWWWTTKTFTLCKFLEGVFNTVVSVWCCYCSKSLFIACIDLRGAFFNYVDKILAFFEHLPSKVYICEGIPLLL